MIRWPGRDFDEAGDATTGALGDRAEGPVPSPARADARPRARLGAARRGDRLVVPGTALRGRLRGRPRPAAAGDPPDGGAVHPQAPARPLRRGAVRALGREPLLSVLLRRGVFPTPACGRSLVADALARAHGRGAAHGAASGEPRDRDPHRCRQAVRFPAHDHRHDGAGEGGCVPDRRQADAPSPRAAGAARPAAWGGSAPVLCAGRQARPDQAAALRARAAVQAGEPGLEEHPHDA